MNILLDAFYDLNYGDDIFIETVTDLFPGCKFYSFLEHYPEDVIAWAGKFPNLYVLPECDVFLRKNMFDAYMCIGGDIFPDNGDFTKRKKYVQAVKQIGGTVIFWGFSLFHNYSEQTKQDIVQMMENADIVAPRDENSVNLLRQWMPGKEIEPIGDLAFLSHWKEKSDQKKDRLGISVRRPNYATDEDMLRYTADLQTVINTYLEADDKREAVIFSLSSGTTSDMAVTEQILSGVNKRERVRHSVYTGNIRAIKEEIANCDLVICTRLHAMISCIAMEVPFIPVAYEVKMEHILQDIGYSRGIIRFRDTQGLAAQMEQVLTENWQAPEGVQAYISRTAAVKDRAEALLSRSPAEKIEKEDVSGPDCGEKEQIIQTLMGALKQRETDVATLETALTESNQSVQQLNAELQRIKSKLPYKVCHKLKSVFFRR